MGLSSCSKYKTYFKYVIFKVGIRYFEVGNKRAGILPLVVFATEGNDTQDAMVLYWQAIDLHIVDGLSHDGTIL